MLEILIGLLLEFLGEVVFQIAIEALIELVIFGLLGLVLAPLATGAAMHAFGARRRRHGRATSGLATFWGGAAFAFAMALARWLAVAR